MHAKTVTRLLLAMALFISLGLVAASGAQALTKEDLVRQAKETVAQVSVEEANALLDKGEVLFIDCREENEFKGGHIPGSLHLPRGLLEFKIAEKVPDKNTEIIIYCRTGGRGNLSAQTLNTMGYTNVRQMEGGWKAWSSAGYPVE
jgi:phage shock protein E